MTRSRSSRMPLLAAASLALLLVSAAPAHALTSASQTFELTFTLDAITDEFGTPLDPFFLGDIFIDGFLSNNTSVPTEVNGATSASHTASFNGGPLDSFDSFEDMGIGDTISTTHALDAETFGVGDASVFDFFGWEINIQNETGELVFFEFSWDYSRTLDLTEMGDFDDATVFLDRGSVFFEDDDQNVILDEDLFPDPFAPGNNPLNIGTLPPGFMATFMDDGTFTIAHDGTETQGAFGTIEWDLGVRAEDVPEPAAFALVAMAGLALLRRR